MIGIAAGLSSEGHKVITTTFAPFQTMRCLEQIKVNLGYMKHKVVMVGLASGLIQGMLGFTHCCIEDISVMRSIPGITVISPRFIRYCKSNISSHGASSICLFKIDRSNTQPASI